MEVRITVETTFERGRTETHDIGNICRAEDKLGPESLGLRRHEAKNVLSQF